MSDRACEVVVEADGGSRGNPGPAGYGAVVFDAATGEVLAERTEGLGVATNNVAEYRGLIAGSARGRRTRRRRGRRADGLQAGRRADVRALEDQAPGPDSAARDGAPSSPRQFDAVTYTWIPRARELARRPAGQRGDGRGSRSTGARRSNRHRRRRPSGERRRRRARAGLDRRDGHADPAAAAAARADRAVGRAPLLRSRRPAADRAGPGAGGRRGGAGSRRSGGHRRRRVARRWAGPGRPPRRSATALGSRSRVHEGLIETDFGEWEGLTFARGRRARPGAAPPTGWRDTSVRPPGGESFDEVRERVRSGARRPDRARTPGATSWWSATSPRSRRCCSWRWTSGPSLLYRLHLDLASLSHRRVLSRRRRRRSAWSTTPPTCE